MIFLIISIPFWIYSWHLHLFKILPSIVLTTNSHKERLTSPHNFQIYRWEPSKWSWWQLCWCGYRGEELLLLHTESYAFYISLHFLESNPPTPKSDEHLISPNIFTPKSNIKFMRIREMIRNSRSSWLFDKFSYIEIFMENLHTDVRV